MQLLMKFSIESFAEQLYKERRFQPVQSSLQEDLSSTNKRNNDDDPLKSEKSKNDYDPFKSSDQSNWSMMISDEQWPFVTYVHRILIVDMDKNASQFNSCIIHQLIRN